MLLIGTRNSTTQTLLTNGLVDFGAVYRKFCKKDCGVKTFDFASNSIVLQKSGIYHITINAIVSAPTAGDVTLQLFENGVALPSAITTETITTATTEFHTATIDYFVLVDSDCVLGRATTIAKSISLVNVGDGATITNVVANVVKVV